MFCFSCSSRHCTTVDIRRHGLWAQIDANAKVGGADLLRVPSANSYSGSASWVLGRCKCAGATADVLHSVGRVVVFTRCFCKAVCGDDIVGWERSRHARNSLDECTARADSSPPL